MSPYPYPNEAPEADLCGEAGGVSSLVVASSSSVVCVGNGYGNGNG